MDETYPCGKSMSAAFELLGPPVDVWPVTDVRTPEDLLLHCMPAFGAAYVRRIYSILDKAIGKGVPLIISVAGPVTVSNQHRSWFNPLLRTGWVAYTTLTDAICYHDGHDSLERFSTRPIREAAIEGMDAEYKDAGVIRVTDTGFPEEILYSQDRFITSLLLEREFQRRMTGPEFRYLLGKYYAQQEEKVGAKPGLLATCWENAIPIFVGAPGDGSVYLNHVKLWALAKLGHIRYDFELDIAGEVFESCAYHNWGLTESPTRELGVLILGGGVSKNFTLQPEPTLGQIFMLEDIQGFTYDVQIVGAPVSDGSLTSCKPGEAVTWGKVSRDALGITVESFQADYSTLMPLIVWALLDKRRRFERMLGEMGEKKLFKLHPEAQGYLAKHGHYRLFEKREELMQKLFDRINTPEQIRRIEEANGSIMHR